MNATRIALFTGAVAMVAAGGAQSAAHSVTPSIKFDLSGHLSIIYMNADDGNSTEHYIADNDASQTRLRVKGEGDIGGGLTAGGAIEFGISALSGSSTVSITDRDGTLSGNGSGINLRNTYLFFSGDFGTLTIGNTEGAADGTSEHDFSGTSVIAGYSASDIGANFQFQNNGTPATTAAGTPLTVARSFGIYDFENRHSVIRYVSPEFGGGMTAGVSYGHKEDADVIDMGFNGNFKLASGDIRVGVGYSEHDPTQAVPTNDTQIAGSVAFKMPSGFNVNARYDVREVGRDVETYNIKVGYITGPHSMFIGYGESSDRAQEGVDGSVLSLGYRYDVFTNMELYAGYNNFSVDGIAADDIRIISAGSRLKF